MMQWQEQKQWGSYGFMTLAELLTVLIIIALLSFIVIPNLEQGERRQLVRRAALTLVQDLRDMQERAISSSELPGGNQCSSGGGNPASVIPRAYGLEFNRNNSALRNGGYLLFADCRGGNGIYNSSPDESRLLDPNNTEPVYVFFPSGVELDRKQHVRASGSSYGPGNPARIAVTFVPPDPRTDIKRNGSSSTFEQAWFRLSPVGTNCTSDPQDCITVWVSQTGRIFIQ